MACYADRYDDARAKLSFLRGISAMDDEYFELMSGERISFASGAPALPGSVTAQMGRGQPAQVLGRA
jgi:hypothetical protein